jgi:hypothetical protein
MMKIALTFCSLLLLFGLASAQSPVIIEVQDKAIASPTAPDFAGLSFEIGTLQYSTPEHPAHGSGGITGYLWDAHNTQLLTLIRNLRIRNLRIGGDSSDYGYTPSDKDIDILFHFAEQAHVMVIYGLRLRNANPQEDIDTAKYIWDHYKNNVSGFAIGNEPNLYNRRNSYPAIHDPASSFEAWKKIADAFEAALPDAPLGGPDTDNSEEHPENSGASFYAYFVKHLNEVGHVKMLYSHDYVGRGADRFNQSPQWLIEYELSREFDIVNNAEVYNVVGVPAASVHLPYRFTEFNNYVAPMPGTMGGNNAFAGALFALDAMHWWASHDCAGVNFHTVIGKYNGTVYRDKDGNFQVYPVAYGQLAFDVGGMGTELAVEISNRENPSMTAYAVKDDRGDYYVTVINKECGTGAHDSTVEIQLPAGVQPARAEMMMLQALNNDPTAVSGVTLGGAEIPNNGPWQGKWSSVNSEAGGALTITLPAPSAAIVRFAAR